MRSSQVFKPLLGAMTHITLIVFSLGTATTDDLEYRIGWVGATGMSIRMPLCAKCECISRTNQLLLPGTTEMHGALGTSKTSP